MSSKTKEKISSIISNAPTQKTGAEKILDCKNQIQKLIKENNAIDALLYGQSIVYQIIQQYWEGRFKNEIQFRTPLYTGATSLVKIDKALVPFIKVIGVEAAKLDCIEASYLIGNIYTATIPEDIRARDGVFYTPPNLTSRLLNIAFQSGIKWESAKVLDPACGGGAFLAPAALQIISALKENKPSKILDHIESHLKGFEIDPFSAWLSQVFVEVAVSKYCLLAKRRLKNIVEVRDSLQLDNRREKYDLVIGNPPYGKIKLTDEIRDKFKDSLYGHVNLYGLFVHVAFDLIQPAGIIAYVTPTGFLGGEYFKNLRAFICSKGTPVLFDFVSLRKGVFDDVLQETMLTTYKAQTVKKATVTIHEILATSAKDYDIHSVGSFPLPANPSYPWFLSRDKSNAALVKKLNQLPSRLKDWGYEVKTGPLVWNRFKPQLSNKMGKDVYPLIWGEAVQFNGRFNWKAEKANHTLFFKNKKGSEWLLTTTSCILLQRTTAKEQSKRLISAVLPSSLLRKYKAVVIENHLNIIRPVAAQPLISLDLLNKFLNSKAANDAFRCISGSVAVSAYELESLPLPNIKLLADIEENAPLNAEIKYFEEAFIKLYQ